MAFLYLSRIEFEAVRLLNGQTLSAEVLEQLIQKFPSVGIDARG